MIVVVKAQNQNLRNLNGMKPGLRLRVMNANHVDAQGRRSYLVQKETADHPLRGLFSVRADEVEAA